MVDTDEPVGQGPRPADVALEPQSRALRISADAACGGLLFYSWFAGQEQLAHLLTLWLVSNLAIPWPRIRERLRQHSMVTVVILLLGVGLIAATLLGGSFGGEAATLYQFRNVFQGLMFALTGLSNLVAVKAYPERKTTTASLCCGTAAVVAGLLWVWLTMRPGGT